MGSHSAWSILITISIGVTDGFRAHADFVSVRFEPGAVMSLSIRSAFPRNVFELMGKGENSATYALGWVLERSPRFAWLLASDIAGHPIDVSDLRIVLQKSGDDRGYTDVELCCEKVLHAIIEAKQGFELPGTKQLSRYRPRLRDAGFDAVALVTVSAIPGPIARLKLPKAIDGVVVKHLSWGAVRGLAKAARREAAGLEERLWLRELIDHLEDYAAMNRTRDNMVYVVSLGSGAMRDDSDRTWIDVVERDQSYFHPVGNHWPIQPPNYIGFRYLGQLQSVHRIESFDIVNDVSIMNPTWCSTDVDHFVYKLGPAMKPPKPLGAGGPRDSIKRSARVWCAIDTLLSGQFEQLGEARDETKRRAQAAEDSDA